MLLSRTRKKWADAVRLGLFKATKTQSVLDERDVRELELSMGFPGQWEEHRRFQIDFLKSQGLQPGHSFLEIGCGPLTAGLPLMTYLDPGGYTGVDVRESVLNLAWREVAKAGLADRNARLIHAFDFGEAALGNTTFDFVMSFSVLYHLTDELLDRWFATVARRLSAGSVAFANVNTMTESSVWLQFPFLKRTVETYRALAERHGLDMRDLGTLESLGFRLSGEEKANPLLALRRK